jgi:flagellar protein FliS
MSYASRRSTYLEAEVLSCPPEWLVPLLYEHLLVNLRRAAVQIEARDIEGKCASLEKASSIVLELAGALNHEEGGELAGRLSALYGFFAGEIMTIGRTLELARLERLVSLVAELHEGWVQAAETVAPRGARQARSAFAQT